MDPARPGGCAADVQKRSSNVIRIPTLRQTKDSQDRQPNDSFFRVARDDFFDPSGFHLALRGSSTRADQDYDYD